MYLYVGSIAVIICIYIWVLIDSCSSIQHDSTGLMPRTITTGVVHDREPEMQNMATSKFGSLKKAHISRDRTSNTSFYLRIGAIGKETASLPYRYPFFWFIFAYFMLLIFSFRPGHAGLQRFGNGHALHDGGFLFE